ncbi:hypothetical protein [Pseudomonas sp. NBRC 111124]|uniref:hypothetical protein n=1 Tax=Pseudomonas sp. NBRC 111124 TaxID=1661039 RepID=UPI00076201AE|nr:hypothetical protein [Pseudomonas sp. NBRC 111124]
MLNLSDKRHPNSMDNIADFLSRWHSADASVSLTKVYTRSPSGRINFHGTDDCAYAFPYARFDSHFTDALEPLVRPLVECLVNHNFITYTSCEGHAISPHLLELHVGVINPTDVGTALIQHAVAQSNDALKMRNMNAEFQLYAGELYCETHARAVPCLDLYLEKNRGLSTALYLASREAAVSLLVKCLQ